MQSSRRSPPLPAFERDSDESESDWEEEDDDDDDDDQNDESSDETRDVISSPTGLKYNIAKLSPSTKRELRNVFSQPQTPPQISLELCGIREEDGPDDAMFYAFQMHEVVPCSIRIGSKNSTKFPKPKCECPDARYRGTKPCKHLVWLFDKITQQTLLDHDPDSELIMTEMGYPEELGDPFDSIRKTRLDVLADGLHCDTSTPNREDTNTARPNPSRVREAREMVAAVAGIQPWDLHNYRPDLNDSFDSGAPAIHPGDLEATLFSLILASRPFAAWVRAELEPSSSAVDPFRALYHRAIFVLAELDAYSASLKDRAAASVRQYEVKEAEGPRDVAWAAKQIQKCVSRVEKLVSRGAAPLAEWERESAARALVSILKAVVEHNNDTPVSGSLSSIDDRNIYMRLIGNHDTGFVHSALELLVDQSQFIEELEVIMERLGQLGTPATYASKMRNLITRMRSYNPGRGGASVGDPITGISAATTSAGSSAGGFSHRSDTHPFDLSTSASGAIGLGISLHHGALQPGLEQSSSSPASHTATASQPSEPTASARNRHQQPEFLTPNVPASALGRGGGGARGGGRGAKGSSGTSATAAKRSGGSGSSGNRRDPHGDERASKRAR